MIDYFGESEIGGLDIEIAFHYLQVWCYAAKEVVGLFVSEISQAQNLADLIGGEKFLELWWLLSKVLKRHVDTKSSCKSYLCRYILQFTSAQNRPTAAMHSYRRAVWYEQVTDD